MSSQWALGGQVEMAGVEDWLLREWEPDTCGVAAVAVTEEVFGSDADDGDRVAGEHDAGADERGVAVELRLPYGVADYGDGRCALAVIFGCEEAPGEGLHADDREVVAGDEADVECLGGGVAFAARADGGGAGLHGGEAVDAGSFIAQSAVEVVGEDAPVALQATVDAALDLLAYLVELLGVLDGHGAEDDLVGEGEDGGGGSDAEG